jgi:hypothetical protein
VERHVGKLASQYSRASKFYAVKYDEDRQVPSRARNEEKYREDASLHGCHHPRTSRRDLSDDEIWLVYIMLTRVETAFHLLKGEPGLRPFYHWKEDRCDAHVLDHRAGVQPAALDRIFPGAGGAWTARTRKSAGCCRPIAARPSAFLAAMEGNITSGGRGSPMKGRK